MPAEQFTQRTEQTDQGDNEVKLHELPLDHPHRNTPIKDIDVTIVCVHTGAKRNPRTWKIKNNTYNELNSSWQKNFYFQLQEPTPTSSHGSKIE